jgi:hypothetical protein
VEKRRKRKLRVKLFARLLNALVDVKQETSSSGCDYSTLWLIADKAIREGKRLWGKLEYNLSPKEKKKRKKRKSSSKVSES